VVGRHHQPGAVVRLIRAVLVCATALLVACSAPPNPLETPASTPSEEPRGADQGDGDRGERRPGEDGERGQRPPGEDGDRGERPPGEDGDPGGTGEGVDPGAPDDGDGHYFPPPEDEPDEDTDPCALRVSCDAGYRAFLAKAKGHAAPVSKRALASKLALLDEHPTAPGAGPSPSQLAQQIFDGARIGWMVQDLSTRTVVVREETPGVLVIDDPWVGEFAVHLALPPGAGPFPAVLVHPGHGETPADHLEGRWGSDFPAAGVAVAILEARAHAGDEYAAALTYDLLRAGHTLVGLRLYELLVVRKVLASRSEIASDKIVIAGHSGGALVANLAARVEPRFAGLITDLISNYLNVEGDLWMDECAPDLVLLQELVAYWPSLGRPVLELEYGAGDPVGIRQFVLAPQPP